MASLLRSGYRLASAAVYDDFPSRATAYRRARSRVPAVGGETRFNEAYASFAQRHGEPVSTASSLTEEGAPPFALAQLEAPTGGRARASGGARHD
jgi:hypothetical protein